MKEFEIFYTTADVGIKIRGISYGDLYKNALFGFNELIFGEEFRSQLDTCNYFSCHSFRYRGDSCENVLVNLLSEAIYLLYSEQKIIESMVIEEAGISHLFANFKTRLLKTDPGIEIKSVTYHNLKVIQKKGRLETEIIFDI
jgi:SHS2 domain-containing protein